MSDHRHAISPPPSIKRTVCGIRIIAGKGWARWHEPGTFADKRPTLFERRGLSSHEPAARASDWHGRLSWPIVMAERLERRPKKLTSNLKTPPRRLGKYRAPPPKART
jgi:hypothetical protein